MNEEEIAAKKHIKELEKEFSDLSIEFISAWDSWQYQKTIVEDLKNDRQDTKIAKEELIKKEEIYNNIEITNETRQQAIEREIKEINQIFPNLKEVIKKEKEKSKAKAKEESMKFLKVIASTITIIITASSVYDLAKWRSYEIYYDQYITERRIIKERIKASGKKKEEFKSTKSFDKTPVKITSVWPILATADRYQINLASPSFLHLDVLGDSWRRAALVANISNIKKRNGFNPKENDKSTISRLYGMSNCWWIEGFAPSLLDSESNILKEIVNLHFIDLIPFFWLIVSPSFPPIVWILIVLLSIVFLLFKVINNIK